MEFRVLGPLEVVEDGKPVLLERRLTRALLAYLLLRANEPVSAELLIEDLWPSGPPPTARASLQNSVARLRSALGPGFVSLEPAGYVLRVDPERFDLARFDRLVAEARAVPARERAQLLRAALSLWRGEPLEDLAFEEFAQVEIKRLVERRVETVEERIGAELEVGAGPELVAELEALIAEQPLREGLRGQLMLALYRAGRQADALAAYGDARRMLREELGLEPSAKLRALELAILRQDPGLHAPGPAASPAVETRQTVTVLHCDLVDWRQAAATLDPEVQRSLLSSHLGAVGSAVEAHGGAVQRLAGGALMGFFGVPELHEDDALRAVRAAVEAVDAVAALRESRGLAIRIGVGTGEAIVSGADVTGAAADLASQLGTCAAPGEIILSAATWRLVDGVGRAEEVAVDGVRAWRLAELSGEAPAAIRPSDVRLVGRADELRKLQAAFERAGDERSCSLVTVVGDAGIGKTRLVRELIASLGRSPRVLVGRCASYGAGGTYLPVAEIVRQAAPEASVGGIAALLAGEEDADRVAHRIAELAGFVDAPAVPGEAFWAVRRLVEALARERPLLVVLDDVHWAEPTLLDLVEYLGRWAEGPILVVCIARGELLEARPGWGGPSSVGFVLELVGLPPEAVAELVEERAGRPVATDVAEWIAERASGNPLFAEQLLALADEAPDAVTETPPTLEALIASRLGRLDPAELAALRLASVIGRRFTRAELKDLGSVDDATLGALERRGLVHGAHPSAAAVYSFHHVLVRDVAYRGIPKVERAELHEHAADALDRRDGPDELVGYHLEQASTYRRELAPADARAGRLALAAGKRLGRAGIRAWKRADAPAAANLLGRAAALLPVNDESRAELLCELGVAVWAAGDARYASEILGEAVQTSAARGDRRAELRAKLEHANLRLFLGEAGADDELLDLAAPAVMLFEELGDDRSLGRAWLLVSYVHGGLRCRYAASLEAAERARACFARCGWHSTQQITAALFYGPTPAGAAIERCEALLGESDRYGAANALVFLGGLCAMRDRFDDGLRFIAGAGRSYDELGLAALRETTLATVRAEIEMLAGDPAAAVAVLLESCRTLEQTGDHVHLATQAAQLADGLYAQGRYDEAGRWTRVAETSAAANDASAQLAWRAVRAKVLARAGRFAEAEALARAAVALADETDALNHRGRVRLDLAEVLRLDRRVEEASTHVEKALQDFEQKENDVSARRARELFAELAPA